jgi:hypothetical protein
VDMGAKKRFSPHEVMLFSLIFALLSLSGCDMQPEEDPPPPPPPLPKGIPVASIRDSNGNEPAAGVTSGNYRFEIKWEEYDYTEPLDSAENITALQAASTKWGEYKNLLEARPFYPPRPPLPWVGGLGGLGGSSNTFDVWYEPSTGVYKLDNNPGMMQLVIQRFWLPAWGTLTTANWAAHRADRVAAFKKARAQIETLMATVKASPFYDVVAPNTKEYLHDLHDAMEQFIRVPASGLYTDYGPWTAGNLASSGSSRYTTKLPSYPLYELYFGHIPEREEYRFPKAELTFLDDTP